VNQTLRLGFAAPGSYMSASWSRSPVPAENVALMPFMMRASSWSLRGPRAT
jgi:hypothetical protein